MAPIDENNKKDIETGSPDKPKKRVSLEKVRTNNYCFIVGHLLI